jgi:nitroreductase
MHQILNAGRRLIKMDILELMKNRRSIRKYQDKQISKENLEKIIEAGLYAPNAGGGQRGIIVACQNKELNEKIGKLNIGNFSRKQLAGSYVSSEQPSIIDDPSIKSGFYGAPTVVTIFGPKTFLYSVPDAFCIAENMVLEAYNLGINSCIIARGEETFEDKVGKEILKEWKIPENYIARAFVLLGYVDGVYPMAKPRKEGRYRIIE